MTSPLLTKLQAVNIILKAIDEPPVPSLELGGLLTLDRAITELETASALVQSTGWSFNTEKDFPLVRNTAGEIVLGDSCIKLDVNDEYRTRVEPVLRGTRLYDRKNHTYVFTEDLKGTVTWNLGWDDLPQPARLYIAYHAAAALQGTSSVSAESKEAVAREQQRAYEALNLMDTEEGDYNMVTDSRSVSQIVTGFGSWL